MSTRLQLKAFRWVAVAGLATLLVAGAALSVAGMADDLRPTDVALVLGSKVELSGQPSNRLAARLERSAALYSSGAVGHVIVSGGTGVEGFDEASVMRDYLVGKGVPARAILVDSAGATTEASARNCADLMRTHKFKSVTVVSQYFHIPRARLALRRHGVIHIGSAHAQYVEWRDLYSIAREVAALPAYWMRSRAHGLRSQNVTITAM